MNTRNSLLKGTKKHNLNYDQQSNLHYHTLLNTPSTVFVRPLFHSQNIVSSCKYITCVLSWERRRIPSRSYYDRYPILLLSPHSPSLYLTDTLIFTLTDSVIFHTGISAWRVCVCSLELADTKCLDLLTRLDALTSLRQSTTEQRVKEVDARKRWTQTVSLTSSHYRSQSLYLASTKA